jgi:hypothetical protein
VEELMDKNQPQQARSPQKLTFQHDLAFSDEAGTMNSGSAARLSR